MLEWEKKKKKKNKKKKNSPSQSFEKTRRKLHILVWQSPNAKSLEKRRSEVEVIWARWSVSQGQGTRRDKELRTAGIQPCADSTWWKTWLIHSLHIRQQALWHILEDHPVCCRVVFPLSHKTGLPQTGGGRFLLDVVCTHTSLGTILLPINRAYSVFTSVNISLLFSHSVKTRTYWHCRFREKSCWNSESQGHIYLVGISRAEKSCQKSPPEFMLEISVNH